MRDGKISKSEANPRYFPPTFRRFDSHIVSRDGLPHSYLERSRISSGIGIWTEPRRAVAKFNIRIYIYIELPLRRFLDFRAVAASTGRLPLAWEESRPPTGVLEDAESRAAAAAAFINYRTRAVCRWNALRRSSAPNASTPMHAKTPLVRATSCQCFRASRFPFFSRSEGFEMCLELLSLTVCFEKRNGRNLENIEDLD